MSRVFNFSPGPSALPESVIARAREELSDWRGSGCSALEVSHRSRAFVELNEGVHRKIRQLLSIPDTYHVLLMPGGARVQFSMLPQNILGTDSRVMDYAETGMWSRLAFEEGQRLGHAHLVTPNSQRGYHTIPDVSTWQCHDDAAFLHYTPNETVHGVEFSYVPKASAAPLIADMTSSLFTQPIDITEYGAVYAATQKNAGVAGMTLVIIRKDLVSKSPSSTVPLVHDYATQAAELSLYSTPPNAAIYFLDLMLDWMMEQGGMVSMAARNAEKSKAVYDFIDDNDLYLNPIDASVRSRINIPFALRDDALTEKFIEQSTQAGLTHLKGHRRVGGVRANLYNALGMDAVHALLNFMQDFSTQHGG